MKKNSKEEIIVLILILTIQNLIFIIITFGLAFFFNIKLVSYQSLLLFISLYSFCYTDLIIIAMLGLKNKIIDHVSDDEGVFESVLLWYQKNVQTKRNLYLDSLILKMIVFIIYRIINYNKLKVFDQITYLSDSKQSKILFAYNKEVIEQKISIITTPNFGVDKVLELLMKNNPAIVIKNYLK